MRRFVPYLRVVITAFCGLAAVLMCVLWVRSYWRLQILEKRTGSQAVQISSVKGNFAVASIDPRATIGKSYLNVVAGDAADWRKKGKFGFAYHDDGTVTALITPHWLPALLLAAIAVTPWTWQRCRFSLRTLRIATTLAALVLGLIAWLGRPF